MKITVNTESKVRSMGDLFGIFFEDLNHAADGGLYAELVQNRSFEFAAIDHPTYHALTAWEKIETDGEVKLIIETGNPVSNNNPHYLAVDVLTPGNNVGVQNVGFNSGIPLEAEATYLFTCYAKREQDLEKPLIVSLRSEDGDIHTEKEILLTSKWKKYELELTVPYDDFNGRLALTVSGRGKVYLDFVSLFPKDTYKGRKNGMRKDIAEKLEQLTPKFMRFPGGCLVHDGSLDEHARDAQYRWKNTIGPVEERPARRSNWGYNQTLGLGYYEYFIFSEDIGAKPLPVLPAGYDPHHHRAAPLAELKPWIDDALDLIEFANGDITTEWGKKRAQLGHAEPFGLEYIGIGNEEVGAEFFERYGIIHNAVREKYPDIKIINTSGPCAAGGEYERGWEDAIMNQSDLVDEHYYQSPEWFLANHHRYDDFNEENPKVFLGEFASWGNTWYNALVEASYMIGLERNTHAVGLACYAPMLCNVDYVNWKPDMIWFNNHQVYGTANYYVQQLFMNHQGNWLLESSTEGMEEPILLTTNGDRINGNIVLSSNQSTVEYYDIVLRNDDTGEETLYTDCHLDQDNKDCILGETDCINYTLHLKAKELEGHRGFFVQFGSEDEKNRLYWELGGWQNQDTVIGEDINGRNSCLSQYLLSIDRMQEYNLELKVRGRIIQSFVDGTLYHTVECKPAVIEALYVSSSKEVITGDIIVKVVNVSELDRSAEIELLHIEGPLTGTVYSMKDYPLDGENSFENPEYIHPLEEKIQVSQNTLDYVFPGQSITIIRMNKK